MKQTAKDLEQAKTLGIEREDKLTGVPINGTSDSDGDGEKGKGTD